MQFQPENRPRHYDGLEARSFVESASGVKGFYSLKMQMSNCQSYHT